MNESGAAGGEVYLDHDAAVRSAAGFTDTGDGLDTAATEAARVVRAVTFGVDEVGTALTRRHHDRVEALLAGLTGLAGSVRDLDRGVRGGAAVLRATDEVGETDLDGLRNGPGGGP